MCTGVTGQDGAYLGGSCGTLFNTDRIEHLYRRGSHEEEVRIFLHPDKLNDWQH